MVLGGAAPRRPKPRTTGKPRRGPRGTLAAAGARGTPGGSDRPFQTPSGPSRPARSADKAQARAAAQAAHGGALNPKPKPRMQQQRCGRHARAKAGGRRGGGGIGHLL